MPFFLDEARPEISQGDIFDLVPSVYVKQPIQELAEKRYIKGAVQAWLPVPWNLDDPGAENKLATTFMTNARALLVTHDCEIDGDDQRYLLLAMLRQLDRLPNDAQEQVRANRDYRFFHVPAFGPIPESYADFRRLTTLAPTIVPLERRLASLSDTGRAAMCAHMISFFTRRVLKPA